MKYLVISDMHANLEALEATLAKAGPHDAVLVLGDLVGYGADPNAVIERIRQLPGSHDHPRQPRQSRRRYRERRGVQSPREAGDHLDGVDPDPQQPRLAGRAAGGPVNIDPWVEICHGSPFDEDVYIFDDLDARRALLVRERTLCLFGHTHVPAVFKFDIDFHPVGPPRGETFRLLLDDAAKYLVNCGAVGQPRDGDPRAAFGMLDTDRRTLTVIRVPYDVATAQAKIIAAGLPEVLAQRLAIGR